MATVEHPLVRSLQEAGELDPYFDMPVSNVDETGWSPATALFGAGDTRLRELVMGYGHARWGATNNHVAASAFIIAYLTRFIYPMVGQYVLRRRVPRVTLENLAFHRTAGRIDATGLRQPRFAVFPMTRRRPPGRRSHEQRDRPVRTAQGLGLQVQRGNSDCGPASLRPRQRQGLPKRGSRFL